MTRRRIALRAAVLYVLAATASASAISASRLFARADTCATNFSPCPQDTLPSNFCCPAGQQCLALAGNTTLLCCPDESGCPVINPISCSISLQDGDKHPDALIKTTALNGALSHCGAGTCCPFGYSCASSGGLCQKDENQNARPFESSVPPTSTSPPAQSTGTAPEASSTATKPGQSNAGATTITPVVTEEPNKGTSTAVIAGASVAAGLITIALAVVAFLFFKRRRNKKTDEDMDTLKLTRSTSSFGNIISNPIMSEASTWRTDFARKSPEGTSLGSAFSKRSSTSTARPASAGKPPTTPSPARTRDRGGAAPSARIPPIRNMARQSSIAYGYDAPETSPYNYGANYHARADQEPPAAVALPYPQTPPQQREPSSISINVFADPQTVGSATPGEVVSRRFSHMTTFSDMLRSADLGGVSRGEPFVPPTNVSPMSTRR